MGKMRKLICVVIVLFSIVTLSACSGGKVSEVEIAEWEPSVIYTDDEISNAMDTVKRYFRNEFEGCTLTKMRYSGDAAANRFQEWAIQYDADEAIVIYSSFDVDESGGDGSLEPNSTYDDWQWILIRNDGGVWRHATHGY